MRQKTKITITAMAVMLVMALAVTLISFSFADEDPGSGSGTEVAEADTYTNIDYIIKNSNDESLLVKNEAGNVVSDNREYRIVEIGSGAKSTLGTYVDNFGFEYYVINGNKSAIMTDDLAHDKVVYHYFNAKDVTNTSTTNGELDADGNAITDFAIISQADMIYISNVNKPGYSNGNDISEELLALLQPMAVGNYIPIIIDMPGKSGSNGGGSTDPGVTSTTVGNVIGDYYEKEGKYYYTFGYTDGWDAATYFDSSLGSQSMYLTINAKVQANKGIYSNITYGDETGNMAKVLVISQNGNAYSGSGSSMSKTLLEGATAITGATYTDTTQAVEGNVYNITATQFYQKGYNVRYTKYRPKYVMLEEKTVADLETMENLDAYEMIFIESDVKDVAITDKVSKLLTSAMYGSIHVAYNKAASSPTSSGSGSGSGNGSSTEADSTNYKKFYDMLASGDVAAYQNVLLTDKTKLDVITSSTSAAVAKTIADLINASAYRGIGGPGSTASSFSVLEIQPCYPIDELIAAANGNYYYSDGDAMINGLSREEIDSQRKAAGLLPESYDITAENAGWGYSQLGYEYYNWELSKAKIADALDMDASDITLTQMSTEEFSSNKDEILGKYDLVYIGGNTSAIKDLTKYYSWAKLYNNQKDKFIKDDVNGQLNNIDKIRYTPIYRMYSHNGDMVSLDATKLGGFESISGTALLKTVSGSAATSLNGNDISSDNLAYLEEYVAAGMPIVFSSDVAAAYYYIANANGDEKYLQNSIDPESNMCKLLDYCNAVQSVSISDVSSSTNVLWNLDAVTNTQFVSSDSGRLSTYANKVRVLSDEMRTALSGLYVRANKKPKLVLTSSPVIYNFFDESTVIKDSALEYKVDASAIGKSNYTINLYLDDNGNSKFESSELISSTTSDTIKASLASDFFGPLYWKVELVDESNIKKPKVFVTGLSYIRPDTATKQEVEVLEIMPGTRKVGTESTGEGTKSSNTLYFCTDCQQGYKNLYYNPDCYTSTYGQFSYYYSKGLTDDYATGTDSNGIKMGLHEHHFGIVSYDNAITYSGMSSGADDYTHNLADDLNKYFDFEIDIMYAEELERYSKDIAAAYSKFTTDEEKAVRSSDLAEEAVRVKSLYENQKAISDSAEKQLVAMLGTIKGNLRSGIAWSAYDEIIARKSYSQYFAAADDKTGSSSYIVYKVGDEGFFSEAEYNDLPSKWAGDTEKLALLQDSSKITRYDNYKALYQAWATEHDKMLLLKGGFYVNSYTYQYVDWYLNLYYESLYSDLYKNDFAAEGLTEADRQAKIKAKVQDSVNAILQVEKPQYAKYNQSYSDGGIAESMRIMGYRDYEKFSRYDDWLGETYTSVLIGASDRFAGEDITGQYSLDAIDTYVANDGQLILFHDVLSPLSDGGAVTLTEHLRELAGLDKYHLTVDEENAPLVEQSLSQNPKVSVSFENTSGKTVSIQSSYVSFNAWNGVYKSIGLKVSGNQDSSSIQTENQSYSDLYDANTIVIPDGATASTETVSVTVTCTYDGNTIANKAVEVKFGDLSLTGTTDSSGKLVLNVPVKFKVKSNGLYPLFKTTDSTKYPSSVYFMSNISYKSGDAARTGIISDINAVTGQTISATYLPGGYTDTYLDVNGDPNAGINAYKYVPTISWSGINAAALDSQFDRRTANFGSDRAKKNNNAIVTMYPYQLADEIYIGGTHSQAFATDVDYDNLTVLYSLVGGTSSHDNTATYAANPSDGTDNYFIYVCDNIYMCGAGHMKVTGATRDNLNERYLYMNIICNSVRNSAFKPTVEVYDPDSVKDGTTTNLKNNVVKKESDGSYTYIIEDGVMYPNFSFIAGADKSASISKVEIYYNLHYSTDYKDEYDSTKDVLIASWGGPSMTIKADALYYVRDTNPSYALVSNNGVLNLKLNDSYFDANNCAYITIKVTDSKGNTIYQRIKLTRKDKLYNLT